MVSNIAFHIACEGFQIHGKLDSLAATHAKVAQPVGALELGVGGLDAGTGSVSLVEGFGGLGASTLLLFVVVDLDGNEPAGRFRLRTRGRLGRALFGKGAGLAVALLKKDFESAGLGVINVFNRVTAVGAANLLRGRGIILIKAGSIDLKVADGDLFRTGQMLVSSLYRGPAGHRNFQMLLLRSSLPSLPALPR
jgi:hypothetical protein